MAKPEVLASEAIYLEESSAEEPLRKSDREGDSILRELSDILDNASTSSNPEYIPLISAYTRRPGGLKSDSARRLAWPVLLGYQTTLQNDASPAAYTDPKPQSPSTERSWPQLPTHKDENQVRLDVERSFIYYPPYKSQGQLERLKEDLFEVIVATLRSHPQLCYFQGFHDIAQVLLLVLGKDLAFDAVANVSLLRLRDFMLPVLKSSLTHLELLPAILTAADPSLARHLSHTRPWFALAATLTLFAHDVESYSEIARLFDFLLAEEAAVAIYLFASIILARRDELLQIPIDEDDMLSFTLSKLPKPLDFEPLILKSIELIQEHPPCKLSQQVWNHVSKYSVLKTTQGGTVHSVAEAKAMLDGQLKQLACQQRREKVFSALWAYRLPIGSIGTALLVAIASYWLRTESGISTCSALAGRAVAIGKTLSNIVQK